MTPTAEEIVDSEVWKNAMDGARDMLIEDFEATLPNETEALSDIAYQLNALQTMRFRIESRMKATSINAS